MTINSIICIIPARGGSKGILGKNIRHLGGKPLIAHSILAAQTAKLVDQVFVTTDAPEIAQVSKDYGATIIDRPTELANDTASSESVLTHALQKIIQTEFKPELIVFLQCTSPLRTGLNIDCAIKQLRADQGDSLLSVSPSHRFLWQEENGIAKSINYDYRNRKRRQDMNPQYVENGSIYIFKPWVLKEFGNRLGGKISLYVMSEEQNWEIDTLADFEYIEFLLSKSELCSHHQ